MLSGDYLIVAPGICIPHGPTVGSIYTAHSQGNTSTGLH